MTEPRPPGSSDTPAAIRWLGCDGVCKPGGGSCDNPATGPHRCLLPSGHRGRHSYGYHELSARPPGSLDEQDTRLEEVSEPGVRLQAGPTSTPSRRPNMQVRTGQPGSLTSSSGGSSVIREAREAFNRWCEHADENNANVFMLSHADELLDAAEAAEAALVAATARAERLQETNAALSRSAIANRDGRWAAEARAAELEAALTDLGWDIGEAELCWCPEHWWGIEPDTGAQRNEEHSPCCVAARHVLARGAVWRGQ